MLPRSIRLPVTKSTMTNLIIGTPYNIFEVSAPRPGQYFIQTTRGYPAVCVTKEWTTHVIVESQI